jgi:hypothetical protein
MDSRGQKKQQNLMYILLEAFFIMFLRYACFIDQAFFWKKAKLPAWGLLSSSATLSRFLNFQMLEYKNFVVDGNVSRSCQMTGFGNGWWHLKSTTRSSNIQPHPPHLSHVSSLIGSLSHVTQN